MTIAIFVLDSFFPLGFVVPALYLFPIILTIRVRPLAPFVVAACATGLTLAGHLDIGRPRSSHFNSVCSIDHW